MTEHPLSWHPIGLLVSGMVIVAWFILGLYTAPFVFSKFTKATAGYVGWMVHTFDRMFMTVSARVCVGMIMATMILLMSLGFWLTSGLPSGSGFAVLRFLICFALVFGPIPFAFPQHKPEGVIRWFLFGLPVGYNLPRIMVQYMWDRRIMKFQHQMLDALTFMSNGLKSGLSLVQSMDMVKEELPNPISEEIGLVLSEQRLGVQMEDALLNLEERIDTEDLQIMVTSINILRTSGGNLSETFDTISYTIRERMKVEGKIKSLTAQGVSQGVIIVFMPFVLGFILWFMDHSLIERLWTTAAGWVMILAMMTLQVFGAMMIKKIVTIDV
jgi:Flp pilus assembly protein TadB